MPISEDHLALVLARDRDRLTAWIWAIVRDHDIADDVYQELCVAAVRNRANIDDDDHLSNWLRTTARHRSIDALRARRSSPLVFGEGVLDRLEQQWAGADRADDSRRVEALRICLGELTENNRRIVELRYSQNIRGKALAEQLGRKPNAVFVALSRIHKSLGSCIEKRLQSGGADG